MSAFMDTIFDESVHIVDLLSSDSVFTSEFVYVVFRSFFLVHVLIWFFPRLDFFTSFMERIVLICQKRR